MNSRQLLIGSLAWLQGYEGVLKSCLVDTGKRRNQAFGSFRMVSPSIVVINI